MPGFLKVNFWAGGLLLLYQNGLESGKAVDSPQKMFVINKVHYFDFLVSCLHTFNPLSLSLKSVGDDLGCKCNNIQKHEKREVLQNYQYKSKGVRRRPFIFNFRLNIVLRDSYQANELFMEIEEWKQKFPDKYVKSFIRVLLGVLETSMVS